MVGLAFGSDGSVAEEFYRCLPCDKILRKRTAFDHTVRMHGLEKCDVKGWLVVKDGWTFKNRSSSEHMQRHLKLTAGLRLHTVQVLSDATAEGESDVQDDAGGNDADAEPHGDDSKSDWTTSSDCGTPPKSKKPRAHVDCDVQFDAAD